MGRRRFLWVGLGILLALASGARARAQEPPSPLLVLVSIDGLRADAIQATDRSDAKIPNLRRLLQEGAYAEGVTGVVPSVTYPSHTTLVTGVWPARHGIWANTTFDPLQKNYQGWYWYAEDIRVPALWDSAREAGRTTASIQWPVTVGARISWNIPEVWRSGTAEDAKWIRAVSTPGLLDEATAEVGAYRGGIDTSIEADRVRGDYAEWILRKKRPGLLTLHLTALDHTEHETGPTSAEARSVLEQLDGVIGKVREAAERVAPGRTYFALVGDHGFTNFDQQLNLLVAFREAGFVTFDEKGSPTDWRAVPWMTGGSAAIVLNRPADLAIEDQVRKLLLSLAKDPANGIDRVLGAEELHERGGYPSASFFVSLKPGWRTGQATTGPLVTRVKPGGTHGGLPDLPELRTVFLVVGPRVPAGKNLGLIDMRSIAPTLAHLVGLRLPEADLQPLLP